MPLRFAKSTTALLVKAKRTVMLHRASLIGYCVAVVAVLVDRAHKAWMLGPFEIAETGRLAIAPFLDLILVWNRGVSYGLLTQDNDLGRWLLIALGLAGALLFGWWLRTTRALLPALALGLVIGGALSNVIDRLVYGAVLDFLDVHAAGYHWPAFNLADSAISVGIVLLLAESLFPRRAVPSRAGDGRG